VASAGLALAGAVVAGAVTHGGAVPGGAVVHVTSLADSGAGSLRDALQTRGPKVVVFDIGGVIHLASDLKVSTAQTTIAGQSAPSPVTLTGGSLRLRANDLVVQHIAVRPGPGSTPEINGNRDSITIGGGEHAVQGIRVENVSLSWSVDENADIAGNTQNVTLRNSIIAEALSNAGHPKGRHSMGMLINKDNQGIAITGNLFVSNMFRNPVIARGSAVFVGNNLIANPAENAIHFYDVPGATPLKASIIGNIVAEGPNTAKNVTAVQIPDDMTRLADAQIYLSGNQAMAGPVTNRGNFKLADVPPVSPPGGFAPPANVRSWVLGHAGARPSDRDPVDSRIVAGISSGASRIIDNPSEVGGLPEPPPRQGAPTLPDAPFSPAAQPGLLRIEVWLCRRHFAMGGPATPECPTNVAGETGAANAKLSQRR
jgi:hypothetical protein